MYRVNINRIRNIIVQLNPMPNMIKEYDTHVSCSYIFNNKYIILDFKDDIVKITYFKDGNLFKDDEIMPNYHIGYMNIVLSDFASRIEKS